MKFLILIFLFTIYTANSEVSRSPAVVKESCDLDIPTERAEKGSEKIFMGLINHQVTIHNDDKENCSLLPQKQYPRSAYEEGVRNEVQILFQKYAKQYSKACDEHFKKMGLKKEEYFCENPQIGAIKFKNYKCEKKIEDKSLKENFTASADAEVSYLIIGKKLEQKPIRLIQKEQCDRVKECINQASESDLAELNKLSAVVCKTEVISVSPTKAPSLLKNDSNFDGSRHPKTDEELMEEKNRKNPTIEIK